MRYEEGEELAGWILINAPVGEGSPLPQAALRTAPIPLSEDQNFRSKNSRRIHLPGFNFQIIHKRKMLITAYQR